MSQAPYTSLPPWQEEAFYFSFKMLSYWSLFFRSSGGPLLPVGFSHVGWSIGLAVVYYLLYRFFPLSELRPELTTCCLFSSSLSLSSDRVFPKWIFFTNPVLFKETKRRIMWWFPPSERLWLCLSETFKSKAKPWLNTQTQLTRGVPVFKPTNWPRTQSEGYWQVSSYLPGALKKLNSLK